MATLNDWPRVKKVLEDALEREGSDRVAFVQRACAGDSALRATIDALLAGSGRVETFLETPAALVLDDRRAGDDLSSRTVGTYRLLSRLGVGGMGEVYLAHDDKLDRPVAIKVLSPELAGDRDRLRRFHQEARTVSSLNHPHILVVHDFGELDGRPFMVMEFVEGETLRRRLGRGALPTREALDIATQVAGALAAAHARGLVHRDVKPENVMVRPDGYVKVLDFGVAKLLGEDPASVAGDGTSRTQAGVLVGTPRYMSPEQARGAGVDARTDVWSLGAVIYEMLAGRPPFDLDTPADTIAAILNADVPPLEASASVSKALNGIVRKALHKDRLQRYADADGLLDDLRQLQYALASPSGSAATVAEIDEEPALSPAGERRRATVLVSLVSEYASLLERVSAPDVNQAIGRIRAAAIDIIRRHGGVVNQSIGEEIVSLFGIPAAHEDDELRAVRAALELHAQARLVGGTFDGVSIRLQSGVHAGSVVAHRLRDGPRRYAVTGQPMQTAARLAGAAPPDGVLVSPDCHRRIAPFVKTIPVAAIEVQGEAAPVAPRQVLGESGLENRLEAMERRGLTPYAGRSAEFGALHAQIDAALGGDGRVVLIVGEAGAGKSRMLYELRARLSASRIRIVQGRCRSYGGVSSYLPFVEALRSMFGLKDEDGASGETLAASIRRIDASLEPLIPLYLHLLSMPSEAFPLPRHLRGEHFQAAMLDALAAMFTSCARQTPVLLLLEDWHWADDASRQALQRLAEVATAYPLVIVVTTRPEAGRRLELPDQVMRIQLGPLDSAASQAIVRALLDGGQVNDAVARRLHERTGGNPFFLEEMCQALREGSVGSADAPQLPDSVQAVIRSRLDRLNPEGREAIRVASVIGREFPRQVLSDAMATPDLSGAIDRLKNAGIIQQVRVVPDAVYRFKHVLMQEVTYESLLERQRKALHHAVGRAIQRRHQDPFEEPLELLAYHFSHAELWDEATAYGLRAAARATELSQFADALSTLERVHSWLLRQPDGAARRERVADVLLRQERLCETLGLRGRQLQLTADLIALLAPQGASVGLAEAYLRQGDVSTLLKRFDAADRALATSLRMSRECGDAALERNALRSIGLLRWHQGRHPEALAITRDALAIDRQRGDDLAVVGDLSNLGSVLKGMGDYHGALATLEEALAMPIVRNDPIKRAYIMQTIANVCRSLGDADRARDFLQQADDSARAPMMPLQRSFHLTAIAHMLLRDGRIDESLRAYQEAVDLSRRARHADGLSQSQRMLGEVLFTIGRGDEALPHLREAAQLFTQLEDRDAEAAMRHRAALVLDRRGSAEALAEWRRLHELSRSTGDAQAELAALEGIARAIRRAAPASEEAVRAFEEALALATRLGDRGGEAVLRNTLGVLQWERGAYAEALAHYERALALVRETGDRIHEGLALNSIGVTLSRLERYEEARTALEEALVVNRDSGERRLEAHSLAALGEIAEALGRLDRALAQYDASRAVRRAIGDRRGEGWMWCYTARVRSAQGQPEAAAQAAAEAARAAADTNDDKLRRACSGDRGPGVRVKGE
jgi:serine/threonine protein kinase/tetratricopeptide (TPR) repeat protein